MNFLNYLTSGQSRTQQSQDIFNFNLQSQQGESLRDSTLSSLPSNSSQQIQSQKYASNSLPQPNTSTQNNDHLNSVLKNREELINRYLELNIKYLSSQLHPNVPEQMGSEAIEGEQIKEEESKKLNLKKKIKKINKCGHEDKSHYAKGMCNNCYHKYGRTKKPWNCPHNKLYAAGMCQNCYINNYNRKRREEQRSNEEESRVETEQDINNQ